MDSDLATGPAIAWATPWLVALVAVLLGALAVACAAMVRSRRRSRRDLEQVLARTEELRREVDDLRRSERPVERTSESYVITGVGAAEASRPAAPDARIEGRLFADLVLRESVVQGAALAHGVRRALSAETRNRIRFEMGREIKRARKERRTELREVRRRLRAEQRAGVGGPREGSAPIPPNCSSSEAPIDRALPEQGAA